MAISGKLSLGAFKTVLSFLGPPGYAFSLLILCKCNLKFSAPFSGENSIPPSVFKDDVAPSPASKLSCALVPIVSNDDFNLGLFLTRLYTLPMPSIALPAYSPNSPPSNILRGVLCNFCIK